jgi:arsenate reductase
MAEGLVHLDLYQEWQAASAGTRPAGYVHPLAIQVMSEVGVDLSESHSKPVTEFQGQSFDAVITVCDSAAEDCPVWLGSGLKLHIPFPDPALAEGEVEAQLVVFRTVRDEIRRTLVPRLRQIANELHA